MSGVELSDRDKAALHPVLHLEENSLFVLQNTLSFFLVDCVQPFCLEQDLAFLNNLAGLHDTILNVHIDLVHLYVFFGLLLEYPLQTESSFIVFTS